MVKRLNTLSTHSPLARLAGVAAATTILLLLLIPLRTVVAIDIQESKNASPLERIVSGTKRGIEMLVDLADPSRILGQTDYQPTTMKVVFAGLGRTGTTSLMTAMELLGYTCIHDDTGGAVIDLYYEMYSGKITTDEMYDEIGQRGFNCTFMYQDYKWAATNDDVKVVLSTRDPEKWVDSWLSVTDAYNLMLCRPLIWIKSIKDMQPMMDETFLDIPTGGHREGWQDRDTLIKGYSIHHQNVVNAVPPERLLVYSVKEGWDPLCQFLNIEDCPTASNVPFPHVNDRLKVAVTIWIFRIICWLWPLPIVLPILWLIWKLSNKKKHPSGKGKSD